MCACRLRWQLAKWQPVPDNKDPDASELQELETRTGEFLVRARLLVLSPLPLCPPPPPSPRQAHLYSATPSLDPLCPSATLSSQKMLMRAKKALSERDTHSVLRHLETAHELYPADLEATLLKVRGLTRPCCIFLCCAFTGAEGKWGGGGHK